MTSLLCNLKLLRATLVAGLLAGSCPSVQGEPLISYSSQTQTAARAVSPQPLPTDPKVIPAGFPSSPPAKTAATAENHRLLAPPTRERIAAPTDTQAERSPHARDFQLPKIESFTTATAGLAIVVGLFLVCAWLLRRSGPKPTTPLPSEAVAVLGRVPLAARNFAHLLHVGNKLVLVAVTPEGVSPITEIIDPVEVQRLLGLCLRNHKQSTTEDFQNVLQQLSKEPANGFLGNEAATSYANQSQNQSQNQRP